MAELGSTKYTKIQGYWYLVIQSTPAGMISSDLKSAVEDCCFALDGGAHSVAAG